jgi:hypothetical protein
MRCSLPGMSPGMIRPHVRVGSVAASVTIAQLISKREPAAALREWLMLFVDFLDAKHVMAEAMDTLIGGLNPSTAKPRTASTFPLKRWSRVGLRLVSFETTSSRTICCAPSLAWRTLGRARAGSGRRFGWSTFSSMACRPNPRSRLGRNALRPPRTNKLSWLRSRDLDLPTVFDLWPGVHRRRPRLVCGRCSD